MPPISGKINEKSNSINIIVNQKGVLDDNNKINRPNIFSERQSDTHNKPLKNSFSVISPFKKNGINEKIEQNSQIANQTPRLSNFNQVNRS